MGQRLNIIIVAEGAIDKDGKAITCDLVKDVSTFKIVCKCNQFHFQLLYYSPAVTFLVTGTCSTKIYGALH